MNHTICSINKWPLLAGLFLCAACSESTDLEGVSGSLDNQAKLVIVDYAVDEPELRSVSHEPLPANQRISSLTYLLYDAEGSLVKQREIPDINTTTVWPLKRTTMTWAQREALRDTLKCGDKYTSVFVANANPKLFANEEVLHLTKLVDAKPIPVKLSEVFLSLPKNTAFHDGNMFYLDVNNIELDTLVDRDHPLNCPVMLERIVSRTDFFSDDFPAWNSEFAQGKIREFADKVYGDIFIEKFQEKAPLGIQSWLKQFTDDFALFATRKGYMGLVSGWITDFTVVLNNIDYRQYIGNITQQDKNNIKKILYTSLLKNESLKKLWQPWKELSAKVVFNKCANHFFIESSKAGKDDIAETTSPILDIITLNTSDNKKQNSFTLIGFGENLNTKNGEELNAMKEVQLFHQDNKEAPIVVLPLPQDYQSFSALVNNSRVQLSYSPIKSLEYITTFKTGQSYLLQPINIETIILKNMGSYDLHKNYLLEFLKTPEGQKYGTDMQNFILQITLPDLSQSKALKVESGWTQKQ